MIELSRYLKEFSPMKLSYKDKQKLLLLDRKYHKLMMCIREDFNEKDVENLDEEKEKFFEARKRGEKYYPILKLSNCQYNDELLKRLLNLKQEFQKFNSCYLSKYYIQHLDVKIRWVNYHLLRKKDNYNKIEFPVENYPNNNIYHQKAIDIIKNETYKSSNDLNRNIDSDKAKQMIQSALDELGYKWEVSIESDMLSRMNVLPNNIIRISKTAHFNDTDIEGLIAHEVKGHIARRYYAQQTGLYLFLHGLKGGNIYDEGLAIWNSLNLVNNPKPNVMMNIALKYIVGYNKYRMDFCELFDYIKSIDVKNQIPETVLFKCIARGKREIYDTSILGGMRDDSRYLEGYELVNQMSNSERDDILKWNIGPEQIRDLPKIKEFFKLNKFESLV